MRIVHLSDIHFSANNLDSFEQYYIDAISNDLIALNKERKIDAVCLTGDLVDKGGLSFGNSKDGYEAFITKFWNPIAKRANISNEALFMIPGNHDINENKINNHYEAGLTKNLKNVQDVDDYVVNYNPDTEYGLKRQEDYKTFEKEFYKYNQNSQVTDFESYHTLNLPIGMVGFACINTSWRCSTQLAPNGLVFGTVQIRRAAKFLKDKGCKFIIGLMHHPFDFISDIERDETYNLLQNMGYNAVLLGHTHHGKTNFSIANSGDLFISTARTGFSNPAQEIERYKSGYTILDFNFGQSMVECHYRKYIHTRSEFDKDVELARGGSAIFPIKSIPQLSSNQHNLIKIDATTIQVGHSVQATEESFTDKAIRAFSKEAERLNYNSSKEDFDYVKKLEKELHQQLFSPLSEKIKNIPALQGVFVQSLFERIYSSEEFDETLLSDIQQIRDSKHVYKWYERKVIISAITLSLVSFKKFSPKKADLLIDFLTDFEKNTWESALTGLVIALLYNQNKWDRFPSLKNRLSTLQDLDRVQDGLHKIEQILRLELYKNNFFKPQMYALPFFKNPLNCFLPFYKGNLALNDALDNRDSEFNTEEFEEDMNKLPFLDSYKYVLCLAAQDGALEKVKLVGERYHSYRDKLIYSALFYPYQNIISEYYNYFTGYPTSNTRDFFNSTLSISQNKLKNIILDKFNALEIAADAYMHSKNYNLAIQTLAKILEVDRNHYAANWKTAISFLKSKKPNAFNALRHLEILYTDNTDDTNLLLKIAECHEILKRKDKQLYFLEKAQTTNPESRKLLDALGNFYNEEENWTKALHIHTKAVELYPTDYSILVGIALTYRGLKNLEKAIEYALQAEEFSLDAAKIHIYSIMYDLYLHTKDYKNAIKYASLSIEKDSSDPNYLMELGRSYLFGPNRNIIKAKECFDKSLKKDETYYCLGNLGHHALISGDVDTALVYYRKSIGLFDNTDEFRKSMDIDEHLMADSNVDMHLYNSIKDIIIQEKIGVPS